MPQRTFRIFIKNASEDTTLHLIDKHLCSGEFTSSDWTPPDNILPGEEKGFQAESDGVFTGTEGYVKYEAVSPTQSGIGMIYTYWDNPYWGITGYNVDRSASDIAAPCDMDSSSSGPSQFQSPDQPKPQNFKFFVTGFGFTEAAGSTRSLTPADLANIVTLPWSWIGLAGILKDPVLNTKFDVSGPPPTFGTLGTESLAPLTTAVSSDWACDWAGGGVTLSILRGSWDELNVRIEDTTAVPPLVFEETTSIGDQNRFLQNALSGVASVAGSHKSSTGRTATSAVTAALAAAGPAERVSATAGRIGSALLSATAGVKNPVSAQAIAKAARVIADAHMRSRWQIQLSHHVGLSLYALIQGGRQVGERLLYQRSSPGASPPDQPSADFRSRRSLIWRTRVRWVLPRPGSRCSTRSRGPLSSRRECAAFAP